MRFADLARLNQGQAVGVAVFFGMLGVTLFGLVFTPIFYIVVRNLADRAGTKKPLPHSEMHAAQ